MPDELLQRLRRFHDHTFPGVQEQFQALVKDGQHPSILFIGCSDSRLVPYLLTGTGPGELFIVRNVGAFVPPYDGRAGYHGTSAAIEFAVLNLGEPLEAVRPRLERFRVQLPARPTNTSRDLEDVALATDVEFAGGTSLRL